MKLKKGDKIKILAGKYKNLITRIKKINKKTSYLILENLPVLIKIKKNKFGNLKKYFIEKKIHFSKIKKLNF
jgi:ribosomal protein L24